jgi:hypothetical protein
MTMQWAKVFGGVVPDNLNDVIIEFKDLKLEKQVSGGLVRRGLLAISSYRRDCRAELTMEEVRAALNLNEWLRSYEKTLLAKQLDIEQPLIDGLRGADPFLTDYEVELQMNFYVRSDDPFYMNEEASRHDWDIDTSLMCTIKDISVLRVTEVANDPDYWGLGDDQDHNDMREIIDTPVYQAKHCTLFHELISHHGVPIKHLIRIGRIWADFEVRHQNAVDIDLTADRIVAAKVEP